MHHAGMAGRDARSSQSWLAIIRHNDVWHWRWRRTSRASHATDSRSSGRYRRLLRIHSVDIPAREHRPGSEDQRRTNGNGLSEDAFRFALVLWTTLTTSSPPG